MQPRDWAHRHCFHFGHIMGSHAGAGGPVTSVAPPAPFSHVSGSFTAVSASLLWNFWVFLCPSRLSFSHLLAISISHIPEKSWLRSGAWLHSFIHSFIRQPLVLAEAWAPRVPGTCREEEGQEPRLWR